MRRIPTRCIVRSVAAALVLLAAASLAQAAQRIKLTTLAPKGSSYHRSLQQMGESWRMASEGAVELIIYAGGIQGGEAAMVERMQIDQAQAGLLTAIGLEEIEPAVAGLQNMPMMFRSLDEVEFVGDRLHGELERRMLERGFVVLSWVDTGWVRFFSTKPVVRVADLKKLKLFTWAGDTKTADIMSRAGLKPVPLETADILTGLQTGLIDAVPLPPFYALASQVYRPAPHMLDLEWAPLVGALVVSKRAWDKIPAGMRPALQEAATKAGSEITAAGRGEAEESIRTMQEKWGLTVHAVSPEVEAEWRAAAESAYPTIRGGIVPEEMFDEVRELLTSYRSQPKTSP